MDAFRKNSVILKIDMKVGPSTIRTAWELLVLGLLTYP